MTRADILSMMSEAGAGPKHVRPPDYKGVVEVFERFAELVAAAERAKMALPPIVIDNADMATVVKIAVATEREACAKACDAKAARWRKEAQRHLPRYRSDQADRYFARAAICEADAAAIRARGTP